jgi:hypothetical protein
MLPVQRSGWLMTRRRDTISMTNTARLENMEIEIRLVSVPILGQLHRTIFFIMDVLLRPLTPRVTSTI